MGITYLPGGQGIDFLIFNGSQKGLSEKEQGAKNAPYK